MSSERALPVRVPPYGNRLREAMQMCIRDSASCSGVNIPSDTVEWLWIFPVSYTHLDVYKRQAYINAFLHTGIHSGCGNEHFRIGPVKIMLDGSSIEGFVRIEESDK